jgi:hypothetical protein
VCQPRAQPTAGRAISGRHLDFANGHQGAPDYPVCHGVGGCNGRLCRKGRKSGTIHCTACQPRAQPTVLRDQRRHVDFANGHQGAPDCSVCHGAGGCNDRLCQKRKKIRHYSLSGGAPDCPVWQPRAQPTVDRAISGRHVDFANGHEGHRTVRCATGLVAATVGFARKGRKSGTIHCPVVHRTVRCASHAPSQRSVARLAGDTWTSPTVTRAHRTVRCATRSVAATVGFARKGRKSDTIHCTVVHRTVRCASHAPSQRSVARSAGDTWTSPTVTRAHRTVRCATGPVAATVGFTRKGRKSGTIHCPVVPCASQRPANGRSRDQRAIRGLRQSVTRAHQTVRCATGPVAAMVGFARKGRKSDTIHCLVVHRTVRCASHAPSQRPVARSASDTWTSPTVTRAHRTVRCATGPVAATVGFTRKGRKSCTIHCPVRRQTEGNQSLPNGAPTAIKGTLRRMEQNAKHPLNILQHRDFANTQLVHCDRYHDNAILNNDNY